MFRCQRCCVWWKRLVSWFRNLISQLCYIQKKLAKHHIIVIIIIFMLHSASICYPRWPQSPGVDRVKLQQRRTFLEEITLHLIKEQQLELKTNFTSKVCFITTRMNSESSLIYQENVIEKPTNRSVYYLPLGFLFIITCGGSSLFGVFSEFKKKKKKHSENSCRLAEHPYQPQQIFDQI